MMLVGRAFACCVMPAHTGIKVVFLVEVLPCARNKDMGKDMGVCSVEKELKWFSSSVLNNGEQKMELTDESPHCRCHLGHGASD